MRLDTATVTLTVTIEVDRVFYAEDEGCAPGEVEQDLFRYMANHITLAPGITELLREGHASVVIE